MASKRNKRSTARMAIAQAIINEYQPKNAEEMQEAIKDIFGPMFEAMLQGEMDAHLGYQSNDHGPQNTDNRRNGYTGKSVKSSYGEIPVEVPRDRDGSFEPRVIPKRTRDVSGIEDKVLSMYAKGMSQRDIADTIEDIYGFEISHDTISNITDRVIENVNEWQNRPLKKFYAFLFVDCLYVSIRKETETKSCAVYVILGYDINGAKDILGIWIGEIVGYAFSERIDTQFTLAALDMAYRRRKPPKGLIFHSDRGVQYASRAYRERLDAYGIRQSMSRRGDPYDNAVAENFFSCLKCELIHLKHYPTRSAAQCDVFAYLEMFYNTVRPHSALGWVSPSRFEDELLLSVA